MEGAQQYTELTVATGEGWAGALGEVARRLAPHFARAEARRRALANLQGLLSPARAQE